MSNIPGRIPVKTRALFRLRRDEKGVGGRVRASICCLTPDTEAALKFIREKIEGGGGKRISAARLSLLAIAFLWVEC